MLDNCQKIFKIQFQSKSESGGETPPEKGMKEMKDWNDAQRKAMIDVNDLKQIKNNSNLKDPWLDLRVLNPEEGFLEEIEKYSMHSYNIKKLASSNNLEDLQSEKKQEIEMTEDDFKEYTDEGWGKDNISVEDGKNGRVFLNPYDYIKSANNKMPETMLTIGYFKK